MKMSMNQRFDAQAFVIKHTEMARRLGSCVVNLREGGLLTPEGFADWAEREGNISAQINGRAVYLAVRK